MTKTPDNRLVFFDCQQRKKFSRNLIFWIIPVKKNKNKLKIELRNIAQNNELKL
jgi:hypothetical protein